MGINSVNREHKPGYSLTKYGDVFALNFNNEFAQRLNNILTDFEDREGLPEFLPEFAEQLRGALGIGGKKPGATQDFEYTKYGHVHSVVLSREFGQDLNSVFSKLLVENDVSPAMYSFYKQLETALYPTRFVKRGAYADE